MARHVNRYWKASPSLTKLQNWLLNDESVISVEESDDAESVITVLCGNLKCKFGLKTFCYIGYRQPTPYAYTAV